MDDDNKLILERKRKLDNLKEKVNPYPNIFEKNHNTLQLHSDYDNDDKELLSEKSKNISIAGRLLTIREMGNSIFADLHDEHGKIQIYIQPNTLDERSSLVLSNLDLGDIVGVNGILFKTKTNELTIKISEILLLAKSLRPLPEKFHGIADIEIKYRQRYLDLMINKDSRNLFKERSKIITTIRDHFIKHDFLEIETPMMHTIPGGALAKPFITHHNALDLDLFLRIAPELFLKRCIIGGFEKIFEINRSFRNEGLSVKHNPEFTMIEFYIAYQNYLFLMNFIEDIFETIKSSLKITDVLKYQGTKINIKKPFKRIKFYDALINYNNEINNKNMNDIKFLKNYSNDNGISLSDDNSLYLIQLDIFEKTVEKELIDPTFIIEYPTAVSPLARSLDNNPDVVERFELFIAGREIANGFSELNNPQEQAERFIKQSKLKHEEKMSHDKDFVKALEYGMPPTAGAGIGIDRLIMLLTDSSSIRDVLLFPLMKPKN
ncbi:MAG: lysine--tRNA ligase [Gammaproteobacteria bacterium]|nr:lysine--tRNA ligase [Gammaproteobacteria bacterium]